MTPPAEADRSEALTRLNFGSVDSESEADLDRRFVRTGDFDSFLRPTTWLALGAKGTGKSALFELLTRHEGTARNLAPEALRDVLIARGTGFSDLSEIGAGDIADLHQESGYDHNRLWQLYIAVRAGLALKDSPHLPNGPLKELARAAGGRSDFRLGPLLKKLWRAIIGDTPQLASITLHGVTVDLRAGSKTLDIISLLQDVQTTLDAEGKTLWVLFDKIDELFPADRAERIRTLEGLITASMTVRRTFPRINPKVFLRTDLWRELHFTNKSHLSDKQIELRWNSRQIASLLLKRATADDRVWAVTAEREERLLIVGGVEELTHGEVANALTAIFPGSAYPGQNEASFIDWLVARVTDGQGTVLPREAIYLGNRARDLQLDTGGPAVGESLIGRDSVRDAFKATSQMRRTTYLAEFPQIAEHVLRFEGQTTSEFSRADIARLMTELEPAGDELIREFCDIGLLQPVGGDVSTAASFEVPRLYRLGLGLVIRGRP
jgi:hypothetical protein